MKKKVLALVLALTMVLSLLPVTAMAAGQTQQIFWGFEEVISVSQMEIGGNYIFFSEEYDVNSVVTGLPNGSAILGYAGVDLETAQFPQSSGSVSFSSCRQTVRDGYVSVMQAGPGFDGCNYGTIAYFDFEGTKCTNSGSFPDTYDGKAWYYGCNYGGVYYVGPFYAYTYHEGEYDADDISASYKEGKKPSGAATVTLDDIDVTINVDGALVSVGAGFVTITEAQVNPAQNDNQITLSVGGITKTIGDIGDPPVMYTVTVNNGSGSGSYAAGRMVVITAEAPTEGEEFRWTTQSNGVTFADATATTTSFVMPANDVTVTATYGSSTPDTPTTPPSYYPTIDPTPVIPSVDVDIHDDTLSDAAKAVGAAVKSGKADINPVAGYTKESIAQMQKDKALKLVVEKKDSYDPAEKALIDKAAQDKGKAALVQFLEIDVTLRTMNDVIVAEVDDTIMDLSITVDLSAEMQKAAKEGKTIYVARAHDGKVTFIEGTLNAEMTKFTFDSSKFSTYALVAFDSQTVTSPKTADAGIFLAVSMSVLSVTGSAVLLKKKED
ncbi:MAG: hypothetical protein IKV99_04325 [Oscillospiraceae bacterium]|nr:hypothetical protein [Oscillospiraceae bacterium]